MLVHSIVVYNERPPTRHELKSRWNGEEGGAKHREHLLQRTMQGLSYTTGQQVWFNREKFSIIWIYTNAHDPSLQWDGLMPLPIEIWDEHKRHFAVHPKDISTKRK